MAGSGEAPCVLSLLVWLLAASWVAARAVGRGFLGGLRAWDTGSAAVGRALAAMGRTAARALGPAGRVLRRGLSPVSRRLGWLWRQLCLRALLFLGRPLGRLGRWVLAQSVRAGKWVRRWAVRLAGWLQPVTRAVASAARRCSRAFRIGSRAIRRSAARLSAALGRAWAPVRRAAGQRSQPSAAAPDDAERGIRSSAA